jgi:hypothetical protein
MAELGKLVAGIPEEGKIPTEQANEFVCHYLFLDELRREETQAIEEAWRNYLRPSLLTTSALNPRGVPIPRRTSRFRTSLIDRLRDGVTLSDRGIFQRTNAPTIGPTSFSPTALTSPFRPRADAP